MPIKKELSLLPNELNNNSFSARTIHYLTSVGRYIIVFTELIVISAFISRFWLDRQNSDLSESLRQQKAILESTADFEKEYSLLQSRLNYIETSYHNQPNYLQHIKALTSSIPTDVFFQNFDVDYTSAQISVYSYQENSLIDMIVSLSLNPDINTVDIRKIEKKSKDSKYFVDVYLKFKEKNAKSTI